ncbi:MAG: hypothetical protein PHI73_05290 [Patescibacteria group bacterium]|nr:hypothetical protein [Patescibacteria group bacterium]
MHYNSFNGVIRDIQSIKIQGATAVARATLEAYVRFGSNLKIKKSQNWKHEMKVAMAYLLQHSRPTEPLTRNGLLFVWKRINQQPSVFILKKSAQEFIKLLAQTQSRISLLGRAIIKSGDRIFTHCHSSTTEQLLIETHRKKKFHVYTSETRPLFQGRITAKALRTKGIPVTMIVDSAGPFLISPASGRDLMMNSVVIGADAIMPDGSVLNKIGSFGLTLSASVNHVPVYIVASLLKCVGQIPVKIEKRPAKEVWAGAPAGLEILNFAFDKVPANQITYLVTEFGLIEPRQVRQYAKKYYPWILQ